jgi:hypothetical protein
MGVPAALTTAADIFAIGMIGVVLLTGQSALALQLPAMRDEIERLLVTTGVSGHMAKALHLCMSRLAEQRPTAEQLSAFLSHGVEWWHADVAPSLHATALVVLMLTIQVDVILTSWHHRIIVQPWIWQLAAMRPRRCRYLRPRPHWATAERPPPLHTTSCDRMAVSTVILDELPAR